MDAVRKNSLEESYNRLINIGFCLEPYQDLSDMIDPDVMIFGTTKDEKIFSLEELIEFFKSQYEQMENIEPSLERKRLYTQISDNHSCALIAEEITLNLVSEDISNSLYLRTSCVMQYDADRWRITHWHSSSPVETENDHWHMEEWKRENEKLQKLVDQQTADLQLKNRELEIEAAVERIRAQVTAMQESSDLFDIVVKMRSEFVALGHQADSFWHMRWLPEVYEMSMTSEDGSRIGMVINVPKFVHDDIPELAEWEKSDEPIFVLALDADDAWEYIENMNTHGHYEKADPHAPTQDDIQQIGGLTFVIARTTHGEIGYSLPGVVPEPPEEAMKMLVRFARVFDLAYKRFEDLKAAERQHREAQIELVLERVRAKSMAMHDSRDLHEIVTLVYEQLEHIGLFMNSVLLHELVYDSKDQHFWVAANGQVYPEQTVIPITRNAMFSRFEEARKNGESFFAQSLSKRQKDNFFDHYFKQSNHSDVPQERKDYIYSCKGLNRSTALHKYTALTIGRYDNIPYSLEENEVLRRFAQVFEQSYQRYLDLKKAEEQTREAQIEAALERVRARTMAMKKSDELREAVLVIYEQLEQLHFEATACNIIIMDKESGSMQYWVSGFTQDIYPESYHVPFLNHPYLNAQIEPWKQGEKYAVMEYSGEEKKRFDEIFFSKTGFKNVPEQAKLAMKSLKMAKLSTAYCRYGALQVFGLEPLSEKKGEILRRFAKVFEQTYTRFLDLQKAEAQTREVQIEAALERARAQSMMMQHSDEINTISNAFHEQLNLLGIPSEFSYVWLPDDENQSHQFWASWSEMSNGENRLQSKQVTYPLDKSEPYTAACFEAWSTPDVILEEFIPPKDIAGFFDVWQELLSGAKKLKPDYFPEGIYYSEAYMRYGCFGINIRRKLSEEEKNILKRFSKEFERAYTRFLDLQKAEEQALLIREERDRLEIALNKLEATQDQLIQQEKLASLGQLTAGIAHEIKNPLNFVNNFSELSVELIEEAREEIKEINLKFKIQNLELFDLLNDIESNLKTIHKHGSRADSIVKSMLQHSRGGDGKLEPTVLNPLIKEYVNLAFHGMRAGNDPINVDIDLKLDDGIGEVPLVAEDFSRVILNLCNNGFDAMKEKEKLTADGGPKTGEKSLRQGDDAELNYRPKLTVRTHQSEKSIIIEIEDNGPGIPEEMTDKIMQPFFTTKKGTQGTGLGLSITNDIVKAHGGNLEVASQAGKRTTFRIKLPQMD